MKMKLPTLIFSVLLSPVVFSQQPQWIKAIEPMISSTYHEQKVEQIATPSAKVKAGIASLQDTMYHEEFNGSLNGWTNTVVNGPGGWIWTDQAPSGQYTNEPLIFSTTRNNGVALLNGDALNPGAQSTFQNVNAHLTSPAINTMGYFSLNLVFEHYFRPFTNAQLIVGVSTDGTNFIEFPVRNGVATNSASANPVTEIIPVGGIIGNQPQAYIRFHWRGESHYFWQVDDVRLIKPANNSIQATNIFFNGAADSSSHRYYYTQIPEKHALREEIHLGATYKNFGAAAQPNTRVVGTLTGPYTNQSSQSFASHLGIDQSGMGVVAKGLKPTGGLGLYTAAIEVVSDSVDATPLDNRITADFEVSDTTYALDQDFVFYINQRLTGRVLANRFEFHTADTVKSLAAFISNASGSSSIGNTMVMHLLDSNLNVITSTPTHTVSSVGWQSLSIPKTRVEKGTYYAALEATTSFVWVGIDNDRDPEPGLVMECTGSTVGTGGAGGTWLRDNFTSIPYIRIHTVKTNCNAFATSVASSATTTCNGNDGYVAVNTQFGTSPFTYSWSAAGSGSIGGGQSTDSIYALTAGTYRVTITDANGCREVHSASISDGGAPTIEDEEVENEMCFDQQDGSIRVLPLGGTPPYQFNWSNGESGLGLDSITGLGKGSYTVTITDGGALGCTTVGTYTIEGPDQPITGTFFTNDVTCDTCVDGSLTIFITGGTPPYRYVFAGPTNIPTGTIQSSGLNKSFYNLKPGTYSVVVTDQNGCIFQAGDDVNPYQNISVTEKVISGSRFVAFPNPLQEKVNVSIVGNTSSGEVEYTVYNAIGQKVFSALSSAPSIWIDLTDQPKGVYLLTANKKGVLYTKRVLKQ